MTRPTRKSSTAQPTVVFAADSSLSVYYGSMAGADCLLRVHFEVHRFTTDPSTYVVRHFADATDADRADARIRMRRNVGQLPRFWEWLRARDALDRTRSDEDRRRWIEIALMGNPVSDPLMQLELEMMIDATPRGVLDR